MSPLVATAETTIRAKAEALGLALPSFKIVQHPQLFAQWADRVALADMLASRGKLTPADLDECDRSIGNKATRVTSARLSMPPASLIDAFRIDGALGAQTAARRFAEA